MAGFQSFNRNSRLNNLSFLSTGAGVSTPAPVTVPLGGNSFRATFTSPGTFNYINKNLFSPSKKRTINPIAGGGNNASSFEVLVVAGGGGGSFGGGGGAGGGGGVVYDPFFILQNGKGGDFTVTIGGGGAGAGPLPNPSPAPTTGSPGGDTFVYLTSDGPLPSSGGEWGLTAVGGGGAAGAHGAVKPGGSGGGAQWLPGISQGGAGIQPIITQGSSSATNYGYPGGYGLGPGYAHSGGGGGAGGAGSNSGPAPGYGPAGPGGSGYTSTISGSPYPYSAGAGGGTGGRWTGPGGSWTGGYGDRGSPLSGRGGGCPPSGPPASQNDGVAATGYGAGGGPGGNFIHVGPSTPGKDGYQGIVIIKYTV